MTRRGLTFIEVIVALAVLTIVIAAVLPSFVSYLGVNTQSEVRTQAASAAQKVFETYRLMDPGSMPDSGTDSTQVSVGSRTFDVVTTYCLQKAYCGAGSRDIQLEVNYDGKKVFSAETVYSQLNVTDPAEN